MEPLGRNAFSNRSRLRFSEDYKPMRPYWSGQIQISLVSFGVSLFTATDSKSDIRFHQISRKTGERIRHQKVSSEEGPVENSDIVKGYEYAKGQYVTIEPEEIEHLRLPTRKAIEVSQFVDAKEIGAEFFEKPYFVAPSDDVSRSLRCRPQGSAGNRQNRPRQNLLQRPRAHRRRRSLSR